MARSSKQQPPSGINFTELKQFSSVAEIDAAIKKLQKRIEEVQSLRSGRVPYDDQKVTNADQNIKRTILDIFGPNSPE
jgi:cytochrome c556